MIKIILHNTFFNHCIAADNCGKYWMKQKDDYFELWRKIGSHSEKVIILYAKTKEEAVNNANEWIRYNLIE